MSLDCFRFVRFFFASCISLQRKVVLLFRSLVSFSSASFVIGGLLAVCAVLVVSMASGVATASAAINRELSYQAKLLDNSGLPVADGTYSMRFSLYDASTLGTRLWTASGTVSVPTPIQVSVVNGLFTVYLGDSGFQGQNVLDDTINWNSANLYLGVTINADSEMTPRRQLTASPYAFNANQVQGMSPSSSVYGAASVFAINQTSNTAATGTRTALEVRSQGTSNSNDFLVRAINDLGTTVFSINRQGAVTSSGLLVGLGGVSTTNLTVATVNGQAPCLADGSNCPSGSATQTLQQVTNAGNSTTNTIQFAGGTSTGNFLVQGTATVNVLTATSANIGTLTVTNGALTGLTWTNATGTNTTSSNLFATTLSATNGTVVNLVGTNATFTTLVASLFNATTIATTNLTATNGTTTNSTSTNSTSTNLFAANGTVTTLNSTNGTITNLTATNATSGWLGFTTASGTTITALNLNANNATILGGTAIFSSSTSTNLFASNGTITNLTGTTATFTTLFVTSLNPTNLTWTNATGTNTTSTNLFATNGNFTNATSGWLGATTVSTSQLFVGGYAPCLADGSNCPTGSTTPTLQQVTAQGNTTTNAIQFAGGTSTAGLVVQGTLTATNGSFTGVTATNGTTTNATSTNLFATNLTATNGTVTTLSSTNGTVTNLTATNATSGWLGFTTASGTDLFAQNATVAALISTNGSFTNVTSTNWLGFTTASGTNLIALNLTANQATILGGTATLSSATATNLFATDLAATNGSVTNLIWTNATGTNTTSTNLFASTLTATNGTIATFNATNGTITTLLATNVTSGWLGATTVSTTNLFVGGKLPCLADGTNCLPTAPSSSTLQDVTNYGNTTTNAIQFAGGTSTADFTVQGALSAANGLFTGLTATNGTTTNSTSTNLFADNLTATNGIITTLDSTDLSSTNLIATNATSGWLGFTTASGTTLTALNLNANNATILGGTAVFSNATSTNFVATTLTASNATVTTLVVTNGVFTNVTSSWIGANTVSTTNLYVNGQLTCLADGTNCTVSIPSFQQVTTVGNTTTNAIQFAGGTSTNGFDFLVNEYLLASIQKEGINFQAATTVDGNGSSVTVYGGSAVPGTSGYGGDIFMQAGTGDATSTGGFAYLLGGTGGDSGDGGDVYVSAGQGGAVGLSNGGTAFVSGGAGSNGGAGGDVRIKAGDGLYPGGVPGVVSIEAGSSQSTRGEIVLRPGEGSVTSTGFITIQNSFDQTTMSALRFMELEANGSNYVAFRATSSLATSTIWTLPEADGSNGQVLSTDGFGNLGWMNLPAGTTTPTLQQVTAQGNTTTDAIQFAGGTSTADFTVQGTLSATNGSFTGLTATNGTTTNSTSTNLFATSLTATNGTVDTLSSSNGTITNLSVTNGTTTNSTSTNLFAANLTATNGTVTTLGSTNGTITNLTATNATSGWLGFTTASGTTLTALNLNANNATILGGTAIFSNATSTSFFATNLTATNATVTALIASNGTFTNATTGWLGATTVSTSQLFVGGYEPCLSNGTNCQASASDWQFLSSFGAVALTTSTNDIIFGSSATSTGAAAYFDHSGSMTGTSTIYFGFATHTNVLIGGTSTTDTGLNSAFVLNGDDLFVRGNIGSVSSVYTNGEFVIGSSSTHYGDGYLTKTNGDYTVDISGGHLLPATDQGVSLGSNTNRFNGVFGSTTSTNSTSTNLFANNLTAANGAVTNLAATNATSGWLGFTTASGTTLTALNLNANNATILGGTATFATLEVVSSEVVHGTFDVYGTSSMASVTLSGSSTVPMAGANGDFGYGTSLRIIQHYDSTLGEHGGIQIENSSSSNGWGSFVYAGNCGVSQFYSVSSGFPFLTDVPNDIDLASQDCIDQGLSTLQHGVYLSGGNHEPVLPLGDNSIDFGSSAWRWRNGWFNGTVTSSRLAATGLTATNATFTTVFVTSLNPVNLTWTNATGTNTTSTNFNATNLTATNATSGWLGFTTASGTSLFAQDAVLATLIANQGSFTDVTSTNWLGFATASGTALTALNLTANQATILSGAANLSTLTWTNGTGTNTTSTNLFAANANFSNATSGWLGATTVSTSQLFVGGYQPCLSDGSNCPAGNATPTLQQVTAQGNSTTNAIQFAGGTSTADFTVQGALSATNGSFTGVTATNGTTTNATSTNLFATNLTATNGTVTTLGSTNGTITNLTATNATSGWLGFTTASGTTLTALNLNANNATILGGTAIFSNATSTNFVASNLSATNATVTALVAVNGSFTNVTSGWIGATTVSTSQLFVNGLMACLEDGTNCQTVSLTLQQVTNAGNSTTNTIQFAGGTSTGPFDFVNEGFVLGAVYPDHITFNTATDTSGFGGAINLITSDAFAGSNGFGGDINLTSGQGDGSGDGGWLQFFSGAGGSTGSGGELVFSAGNAGASGNGNGGSVMINAGKGFGTGSAGAISITAGAKTSSGGVGGNLTLRGGDGNSSNGTRGQVVLLPGGGSVNSMGFVTISPAIGSASTTVLRFMDTAGEGSNRFVGFRAPSTVSATSVWTLPGADGTNGQVLTTNGSGILSWSTVSSGSTTPTLQQVTAQGNTTTNAIQFAGGTSTADFTVQGTLSATNGSFTGVTAVNGTTTNSTSTNLFATNLTATNGTVTTLGSTNGTITNLTATNATSGWLGFTTASGTTLTALNLNANNATILGGTATFSSLNWAQATGTTLAVTGTSTLEFARVSTTIIGYSTTTQTPFIPEVGSNVAFTTVIGGGDISSAVPGGLYVTGTAYFGGYDTFIRRLQATNANFDFATSSQLFFSNAIGNSLTVNSLFTAGNVDINGGTIDGTAIGNTVASTGIFTNATSTNLTVVNDATVQGLIVSNSATIPWLNFGTATGTDLISASLNVNGPTNLYGDVRLGRTFSDIVEVNGALQSHLLPSFTSTFNLGAPTATWANLFADTVSTTNLYVGGQLPCLADGTNCLGGSLSFQQVTDNGNSTTNSIQFAGGTSTAGLAFTSLTGNSIGLSSLSLTSSTIQRTAGGELTLSSASGVRVISPLLNLPTASSTFELTSSVLGGPGFSIYPSYLAMQGSRLYVSNPVYATVESFDISDPSRLSSAIHYTPAVGSVGPIRAVGDYLFIGDGSSLITLTSTGTKVATLALGSYLGSSSIFDMKPYGHYLLVSGGNGALGGLVMVDIANPLKGRVVASTGQIGHVRGFDIQGRYAYFPNVASGTLGIVDLSSETSLPIIATSSIAGAVSPHAIAVQGRAAYIADLNSSTVTIFNIENPYAPVATSTITLSSFATNYNQAISVSGKYLYVMGIDNRLQIFDLSDPFQPVLVQSVTQPTGPFLISGSYYYGMGDPMGIGIRVVRLPGIDTIGLTAHSVQAGSVRVANELQVGRSAQVAGDLTVAESGSFGGSIAANGVSTTNLRVNGQLVCLADGTNCSGGPGSDIIWGSATGTNTTTTNLFAANLNANNSTTSWLGFTTASGTTLTALNLSANTVTILSGTADLSNLTWTNGTGTNLVLTNATSGWLGATTVSTSQLFVGGYAPCLSNGTNCSVSNLQQVTNAGNVTTNTIQFAGGTSTGDLSILTQLNQLINATSTFTDLGTITVGAGNVYKTVVVGRMVYAISGNGSNGYLTSVDLTNFGAPSSVHQIALEANNPHDLVIDGHYAYVTNWTSGTVTSTVLIYDISDAGNMVQVGGIPYVNTQDRYASALQIVGNYLYVSAGATVNVSIYDISRPTQPVRVSRFFTSSGISGLSALRVHGKYAYAIGDGSAFVSVIDISDPYNPVEVSTFHSNPNWGVSQIETQGSQLFLADGGPYLGIYGASTGSAPVFQSQTQFAVNGAPHSMVARGRYIFSSNGKIYDVTNGYNPVLVKSFSPGASTSIEIQGRLAVYGGSGGQLRLWDLGGTEVANLIANTAEAGSLQVRGDALVGGNLTIQDGLNVGGAGQFYSVGAKKAYLSETMFGGVSSSTGAGIGAYFDTRGYFTGTSTVYFGYATNTNVVIGGTSTTDLGLSSSFFMNGDDLFVHGNIGSVSSVYTNGAFVAGTSSTYYGDGYLTKTNGNYFLSISGGVFAPSTDLGVSLGSSAYRFNGEFGSATATSVTSTNLFATNGNFTSLSATNFSPAAVNTTNLVATNATTTNGTTTNLTVLKSISNRLPVGSTLSKVGQISTSSSPAVIKIEGHYAYVATNGSPAYLSIFDISNPLNPLEVSTISVSSSVESMAVQGQFLILIERTATMIQLVDVSNPADPAIFFTGAAPAAPKRAISNGRYYAASLTGLVIILDGNNPRTKFDPVSIISGFFNDPYGLVMQDRYLYVTDIGDDSLTIVDVSNPSNLKLMATTTTDGSSGTASQPRELIVHKGYAYAINVNNNSATIGVIDVSKPTAPQYLTGIATSYFAIDTNSVTISGNYLYLLGNDSKVHVFDLSNPALPVEVAATPFMPTTGNGIAVQGRYVYAAIPSFDRFDIFDINGIETGGLVAESAQIGALKVDGSLYAGGKVTADSLVVGSVGLLSHGSISVSATGTTSTILGNLIVGTSTRPGNVMQNSAFAFNGQDLFVGGSIGSVSSVYSNSAFIAGPSNGGTRFGSGEILQTGTNDLRLGGGSGFLTPTTTGAYSIGKDTARFNAFFNGVTTTDLLVQGLATIQTLQTVGSFTAADMMATNVTSTNLDVFTRLGATYSTFTVNDATTPAISVVNQAGATDQGWGGYINRLLVGTNGSASTGTFDYDMVIAYDGVITSGLCLDDTSTPETCLTDDAISISADGAINATAFDLAEWYRASGSVTSTDLLVVDSSASTTVMASTGVAYDPRLIGIASTRPGLLLGRSGDVRVALSGRVPTKVTVSNGEIQAGDPLTSSLVAGTAMKATKPGMIVGYALESATTDGVIEVFVKPGWNANGLIATNASGTEAIVNDALTLDASSAVSSTNLLADSWGLTFRGDAYNVASSTIESQSFQLFADILSTTSSQLTIASTSGTSLFSLNQVGDLMLGGKLYPVKKSGGMQAEKYIFLDDTLGPGTTTYMATNADGWQANDSYDFAERYYSPDALDSGDLVTMSEQGQLHVQRTWEVGQTIMGIVSTRPAFVAGAPATSTYPIALSGRVPTKVSTQNGDIRVGDPLTASTVPGVAVKATTPGPIVGYALQATSASDITKIEVFVNPGWWGANQVAHTSNQVSMATSPTVTRRGQAIITMGMTDVTVNFTTMNAYPNIQVTPYDDAGTGWWMSDVTDKSFKLHLRSALPRDVRFAWKAEPSEGDSISFSDGTTAQMDSLTGQPFNQTQATSTEPTPEPPTQPPTSTEPVVNPPAEEPLPPSEPVTPSSTESMTETTSTTP